MLRGSCLPIIYFSENMIDTRISTILMSLSKLEADLHPVAGNDALMRVLPTDACGPAPA